VRATALDAVRAGFETTLLESMCAGVAPESTQAALAEMTDAGVRIG
jgi:nicotinamidase/pyrazinamidase